MKDAEGSTALHYAAGSGALENVSLLLEAGAEIDARDGQGMTALMYAARYNQDASVVDLLLAHGANPSLKDARGRNALRLFMQENPEGDVQIAKRLQKAMPGGFSLF